MAISTSGTIWCEDERRSGLIRAPASPVNGIDYVEYRRDMLAPPARRHALEVTFLKAPPAGLDAAPEAFVVLGGARIVDVRTLSVEPDPGDPLTIRVFLDREGDFSIYALSVEPPWLDPERSQARFSFKAGCPSDLDCRRTVDCASEAPAEPELDYLAKDYQSFRRLLMELVAERHPDWLERSPADLGVAVLELFAYVGDQLSYFQDAVGTEAFLDACLHRISAARHARLIDYRMHQGRNAYAFVQFDATAGAPGFVPAGAKLVTRIGRPLIGDAGAPGAVMPATADFDADPALDGATVFETTARIRADALHNLLRIHSWGDAECCLARGATEAWLYGVPDGANPNAYRPAFAPGDYLLIREAVSPVTGAAADADPARAQVVRITDVEDDEDPVFRAAMTGGALTARSSPAQAALPLQRVVWRREDALTQPFRLSTETPETGLIDPVSIAQGNVAPADHGRTISRILPAPRAETRAWPIAALTLPDGPLTHQAMPPEPVYAADGRLVPGRHDLAADVREVGPAIVLSVLTTEGDVELWTPAPHLFESGSYDQQFVAEVDNDAAVRLRFGDDRYGRAPADVVAVTARYRIGVGRSGNLGAGSLVHIVAPTAAEMTDPADPSAAPAPFVGIERVFQPLPARLGAEAETIEQVRQLAPEAFRAIQFRAVTEADWEEVALRHAEVAAAKARFRWTGSWHTVFVAIHPRDEARLTRLPGGGAALATDFAAAMRAHLGRFRVAGYDLAVHAAVYVPIEIELRLCVRAGHFHGDVIAAVRRALSNRAYADGSRGFFHPLAFRFGDAVYLSRLYQAAEAVEGVESATALVFKRYWEVPGDAIARGLIAMGPMEMPVLEDDPNFPERGVLRIGAVGGQ
ncbi:hypothetical protein [Hansschlegelia zhihuaiae]|uniref:Baseplate assembly protein n=1 Tax=Hansschlegelia zhihuaiae TaxID=405005 RepID=A0A4Q0MK55_9HYPH|nr:hypothetical protein [Hansschlegelia zhihuaiae]RXF74121.1 hypothetical protein EK403_07045 [Hansschlegelia zhihuaiae]